MTRDGMTEPNPRDQTLRCERGQGNSVFPVQLTTGRIGNHTRLMPSLLKVITTHNFVSLDKRKTSDTTHQSKNLSKGSPCMEET